MKPGDNIDIYEVFGIDKNANNDEIKKAYRKKAKENHPDIVKDKREEFEKINKYYKVLMNPLSRKKYDETGKIDSDNNNDKPTAMEFVAHLFETTMAEMRDPKKDDLFDMIGTKIEKNIYEFTKTIDKAKRGIKNLEDIKKRVKGNKNKIIIFQNIIDLKILNNNQIIQEMKEKIKLNRESRSFLKGLKYETDKPENVNIKFYNPNMTGWPV